MSSWFGEFWGQRHKTTYADVIKAAIPGADTDTCEYVLWNLTPYPMGRVTAKSLFKTASGWHRASRKGVMLCENCHRIPEPKQWICARCDAFLKAAV